MEFGVYLSWRCDPCGLPAGLSVIGALLPVAVVKGLSAPIRTHPLDDTTTPKGSKSVAVRGKGAGAGIGLLGRVAGFRFPVGCLSPRVVEAFRSPAQWACAPFLTAYQARLVSPVVVATADHDVPLIPDDERAQRMKPHWRRAQAGRDRKGEA